jgi:small-conductance mechanosensitive channel
MAPPLDPSKPILEVPSAWLEFELFSIGDTRISPAVLIKAALFVAIVAITASFVRRKLIPRLFRRTTIDLGTQYATARIAGYVVWGIALLVGLPMLGIQLQTAVFALSTIGIGIGLGLQKIAENFVSGIILLFEQPIKVGDRIHLEDVAGTVIEIRSRVSVIRTNDNVIMLVPNAEFVSQRVVNLSHNDRRVRYKFAVGVGYGSDVELVRRCLLDVADRHPHVLEEPAPEVFFRGFGESSLDFEIVVFTEQMLEVPERLGSQLYFQIWHRFKDEGIEIPFPQRDLHLKSVQPELLEQVAVPGTRLLPTRHEPPRPPSGPG